MLNPNELLFPVFGFEHFRPGQEQTIHQLLNNQSSLSIFPTGSGKSLCYQYTALALPHLTLVISPLIALMKDQLQFLKAKGISAASIDSTIDFEQQQQINASVRAGETKILMVSVERFKNERFRQFIQSVPISMLVIDEAHCISEWGHNFRPDYLKLPQYQQGLNIPLVLLLTATATAKVRQDMADKFNIKRENIVQTGFYRENLTLGVLAVSQQYKNQTLLKTIKQQTGCGIIYVTLQHSAEQVAQWLIEQGINAKAYHAGLADTERQKIQQNFMLGHTEIIVATIAFGMGIDKGNIRFVIHYDLPKSIENYSQEIGRAGRDNLPANCITLANLDGVNTLENFVYGDTPSQASIDAVITNIKDETQGNTWEVQLHSLSTATNVRQLPLKTLLVQLELAGVITTKYAYFADFKFKFIRTAEEILTLFSGERAEFLAIVFKYSQFKKVWGEPDFDAIFHHYQGDRQRVVRALEYLHEQQHIELATKKMTDVYQVNHQLLLQPGLVEHIHHYFLEKETSEIQRVAKLINFFQEDRCLNRSLAQYFGDESVAKQCGHCSVCLTGVTSLSLSHVSQWPSEQQLNRAIAEFVEQMHKFDQQPIALESVSRFLTGLAEPIFARRKIRALSGFGLCATLRFKEVKTKVSDNFDFYTN